LIEQCRDVEGYKGRVKIENKCKTDEIVREARDVRERREAFNRSEFWRGKHEFN
jgi:hypothetical protein